VLCFLFCLSSSCVLYAQCYPCLWIVHSWLPLQFSLTFINQTEIAYICTRLAYTTKICIKKRYHSKKINHTPTKKELLCIHLQYIYCTYTCSTSGQYVIRYTVACDTRRLNSGCNNNFKIISYSFLVGVWFILFEWYLFLIQIFVVYANLVQMYAISVYEINLKLLLQPLFSLLVSHATVYLITYWPDVLQVYVQ
jgi:hypothetical protein